MRRPDGMRLSARRPGSVRDLCVCTMTRAALMWFVEGVDTSHVIMLKRGGVESHGLSAPRFPVRVANGEGEVLQGEDDGWFGPSGELDGADELGGELGPDEEGEERVGEPASWLGEADDEVRMAGDHGFSPVRVMRESGVEPVRVEHHEEPLPIGSMGRGFNCVVMVTVGTQRFRMTVDTGAARSLIRAKFADQLRRSAKTREAVVRRFKGDRAILCEGVVKGMETKPVQVVDVLRLGLRSDDGARRTGELVEVEAEFGELEDAADALLLGFPQALAWGAAFAKDVDGHVWVEFRTLGVTLLAEGPTVPSEGSCRLRAIEPQVLEGPRVCDVSAYLDGAPQGEWILDDGWPGVKVVERPLSLGRQVVQMIVEPHQRVVLTPVRCPWRIGCASKELLSRARASAVLTARTGRARAANSEVQAGLFVDGAGEKVLSVRLHENVLMGVGRCR